MSYGPRWSRGQKPDKGPWYGTLGQRFRQVRGYWTGVHGDRPDGFDELRMGSFKTQHPTASATRAEIVRFYEGLVRYMLYWLDRYQAKLESERSELTEARRQYLDLKRAFENSQQQRNDLQEQLDAALWVQHRLYKSRYES